jgi:hypothetical protein
MKEPADFRTGSIETPSSTEAPISFETHTSIKHDSANNKKGTGGLNLSLANDVCYLRGLPGEACFWGESSLCPLHPNLIYLLLLRPAPFSTRETDRKRSAYM